MKQTTMPALGWHSIHQQLDLKPAPADQLSWLQNAVTISLFTDARASLEEAGTQQDLRGYWGDSELPDGESLGSKLWLLQREKVTRDVISKARDFAEEALQWLVEENHLLSLQVRAERTDLDSIAFQIDCQLPEGNWINLFREHQLALTATGGSHALQS